MRRIWHHYEKWEDYNAGMWRRVSSEEHDKFLKIALYFTGNSDLYGSWMMRVIREWKYACEQNLSAVSVNRQAWVGHAAVCMANGCPEYITREAWFMLTQEQRDAANLKADEAIAEWEKNHSVGVSDGGLKHGRGVDMLAVFQTPPTSTLKHSGKPHHIEEYAELF